jgi:hypothetical protein
MKEQCFLRKILAIGPSGVRIGRWFERELQRAFILGRSLKAGSSGFRGGPFGGSVE